MTSFKRAMADPQRVFKHPARILQDQSLDNEQKLRILKQWAYDAREIQVADEENMLGESSGMLSQVLEAIHTLDPDYDATKE